MWRVINVLIIIIIIIITSITSLNIACNFAGTFVNLLAYADDLVLLAPSWRGLQCLLAAAEVAASK